MELSDIRNEIAAINEEMAKLYVRRMKAADAVAEAKRATGKAVFDPPREREILTQMAQSVGPEFENGARLLFATLMSVSRARQRERLAEEGPFEQALAKAIAETPSKLPALARVACPGAEGGYSQQAACALFRTPSIVYFKDFDGVFAAVEQGLCAYGVLPVENSTAGSVTQVYDLMDRHRFSIVRAVKLRIRHVLLAPKGVTLADVKEVASHPHALAQCSGFFKRHGELKVIPASNTAAAAAELAKSGRRDAAVIASRDCASLYGLDILAEDVADTASNFTRFVLISRKLEVYPDANKLTFMMSLPHRAGSLSDVLMRLAAAGVNLTKIESRPVVGSGFEFRFVFDGEASLHDLDVRRLIAGLAGDPGIERFVFLGWYAE